MAQTSSESVVFDATLPDSPPISPTQSEAPRKLKGRKRLLQGIQRMSSSPSLIRLARSNSSSGYRNGAKASVSCISLQSAGTPYGSYGSSLNAELAAGYSTAPTSTATTPGIQSPSYEDKARIRYLNSDGRTSVPLPFEFRPSSSRLGVTPGIKEEEDYFSIPVRKTIKRRPNFNFWQDLPSEIRMEVLSYLQPREVVRCSAVSKLWSSMCFDGQLWANLDTSEFYQDIPADALVKVITSAGPFVRDLNLRGCVQLREKWHAHGLSEACRNLENFSLEGCRIDRQSIHCFLLQNSRLVHINLSGLAGATNSAMKIIAQNCPRLEHLNVSWCNNVDTRGIRKIVEACPNLRDLRAGEVRGWDDADFMQLLFEKNTLERLVLMNCDSLLDESFAILMEGKDSEMDYITGRPIVQPRKLKHLDLTRCRGITDKGLKTCINNIPEMEGLQLSKLHGMTDDSLIALLPTIPNLTHLDLEELTDLSNSVLQTLANSPCAKSLRHISISYCENLGDAGMLPVLKNCTNIRSLDMDNTRISDLALTEAAATLRQRSARTTHGKERPVVGIRIAAYDCQNVTWTGIREVLSRNAEIITTRPRTPANSTSTPSLSDTAAVPQQMHTTYPTEIIQLKCFYNYQPTVEEHTKRALRGDFGAANRLERKWAEFMIAQEEAGASGAGARRRRRRAREAQMMHADEEDAGANAGAGGGVGGGRRRRARSGGCAVM
ncbi:hypothetical protein MBLNU459_g1670t1 [Dothideomycetes sp. NU459]